MRRPACAASRIASRCSGQLAASMTAATSLGGGALGTRFPRLGSGRNAGMAGRIFASTANLDPSVGNSDHNFDLFVYDKGTSKFIQITNTTVPSDSNLSQGDPKFSDDGTRIVFVSEADLVGQNDAHNFEVFLATLP